MASACSTDPEEHPKRRKLETEQQLAPPAANRLEGLKQHTCVVCDTGDLKLIEQFKTQDATTNPSLILQAVQIPMYQEQILNPLIEKHQDKVAADGSNLEALVMDICDQLAVAFGLKILDIVPGLVSTEADVNLSFDVEKTVAKARKLISLYEASGASRSRVMIKIASTWEGFRACEILEKEGIHCNMTLLFSLVQAVAAAEAGATMISPYIGRVMDYFVAQNPDKAAHYAEIDLNGATMNCPGVQRVHRMHDYFKSRGYKTQIMAASFRSVATILAVAGLDKLTIFPAYLAQMEADKGKGVQRRLFLHPEGEVLQPKPQKQMTEAEFRWQLIEDAAAPAKLAEGMRAFDADHTKLKKLVEDKLRSKLT